MEIEQVNTRLLTRSPLAVKIVKVGLSGFGYSLKIAARTLKNCWMTWPDG